MPSRDEYLQQFKAKLDEWDAEIDRLQDKAAGAQADAQEQYQKQLAALREMRDDAFKRYAELQNAAGDAWDTMLQGTEKAWNAWLEAFDEARRKFTSNG